MVAEPSPAAAGLEQREHATVRWASWRETAWRSTVLGELVADRTGDDVQLPAVDDQLLMLVTGGQIDVEASSDGTRWQRSHHVPGRLAMTAPGRSTWLRWRTTSAQAFETLHLYIPGQALRDVAEQVWARDVGVDDLPETLSTPDPLVESVVLSLAQAARAGADELYAESALQLLAVHVLSRSGSAVRVPTTRAVTRVDPRIPRVVEYLHDNLALPLSLGDLAAVAQLSPFHFLRLFRDTVGEPPHQHLTRLRVEAARRYLERSDLPVSEIAYLCGFSSPAHLSAVFRRWTGSSPTRHRLDVRG